MNTFEEFRQQLQHALTHLHDPSYVISAELSQVVFYGQEIQPSLSAFQSLLINAIEALKPPAEAALDSRANLIFQILEQRFIFGLIQEQAAERLNLSIRSLQRLQREATHILARYLWNLYQSKETEHELDGQQGSTHEPDWLAQLKQELLLLQSQSPQSECDLNEVVKGALRIAQATEPAIHEKPTPILFLEESFQVSVKFHPIVLRQLFVELLSELLRIEGIGLVQIKGQKTLQRFHVFITASPVSGKPPLELSLASELLASQSGTITVEEQGGLLTIQVDLPLAKPGLPIPVLVVDDNSDLFNLYQSYCTGAPFQLYQVREGQKAFEEIRVSRPEIIMLDILLPDINGLDLLLNLKTYPETKPIPVIICSVTADERLVHDLGAAMYLRKPVWKHQLLSAFEEALNRVQKDS